MRKNLSGIALFIVCFIFCSATMSWSIDDESYWYFQKMRTLQKMSLQVHEDLIKVTLKRDDFSYEKKQKILQEGEAYYNQIQLLLFQIEEVMNSESLSDGMLYLISNELTSAQRAINNLDGLVIAILLGKDI